MLVVWMVLAGCGAELLTISLQRASEAVIVGVEVPDDLEDVDPDDLDDLEGVDPDDVAEARDGLGLDDWLDGFDDQLLADEGIEEGDVSEIRIVGLTIEVLEPTGVDLTFLDVLELWVSADGVREQKIAGRTAFLPGVTRVEMVDRAVDLAPFAIGTGMAIRTVAEGLPPEVDTTVRATVHLEVGLTAGGLLGQLEEL